ncbi:response regulator receiver modulated diguanylate cyclase phosphodiesterase with pas pac sensor [Leptolyngbya sp. Heron Island J]|uniref:putative bifunctional diguanylate cyclase/phosphodiesterase n=1 Tax=Leptolyngbya sp. Heron Island J TaxID=1385935 RepID=UPI0003B9C9BF|nr:EAL domain-containing protein [Leptolyngbya sp. Heron Island J]ESA34246.1 response regulator receiver modulated diguanylate cyclase phosphodiesterase with pas pac sensor [Leptolyngbya sp. Heron Island J]
MDTLLNVLIIEDSEDDALLIVLELRRGNFKPVWEQVETADELRTMLATRSWDVIIADYHIPGFNAPAALEVVKQSQLDIPFIIVSGKIGEQLAVEMLKAGANDYLMKDNLIRLPEAVRRELREACSRVEQKQTAVALEASEACLRLVTENMSDLVCLHDPIGRYLYVTPSSHALLGYRSEELKRLNPNEFIHPNDREQNILDFSTSVLSSASIPVTYRMRTKAGEYIWLETLKKPIFNKNGALIHWQTTSRNVSERVRAQNQLKHDALHDKLTGLPNRSLLMERLQLALKRAKRSPDYQFAVLFLDLDNFKVINDSLGHFFGDELLLVIAKKLTQIVREMDLVVRLGGDEFVILLEEIYGIREAVRIAERLFKSLCIPIKLASREVFTSASIGIVLSAVSYQHAEELLRDADLAMYRAKNNGRGQYAIFDTAMRHQVVQQMHLENELRQALKNEDFILYYQPIINLETRVIQGFEALIRWQHPQRGLISPSEFIQLAEEIGVIVHIGESMLHLASQQLEVWQTQFPTNPLSVSVNLSVSQLHEFLLEQLDEIINIYSFQPSSLALEITESMLVQHVEETRDLLERIKSRGIQISIDDFGTGYSSLSYLHKFPIDTLKIDREFVSLATTDTRNHIIAESLTTLSHLLGLDTIAEGIETTEQLAWLREIGCQSGQGFLFSHPISAAQATKLLANNLPNFVVQPEYK